MATYAVVVGIDQYGDPEWALDSAVSDALRFAWWALAEGVPADNIRLFLSPKGAFSSTVGIPNTSITLPAKEATHANVRALLYDDFQENRWAAGGDRLYFYLAGHGCSHPEVRGKKAEPVLIFPEAKKLPRDSLYLFEFSDILRILRGCGPGEQFFFIDACRDFGLDGILSSGGKEEGLYLRPATLPTGAQAARQFVMYATAPGLRSVEFGGKGVFGAALIKGLKGDPGAVQRRPGIGDYALTFASLYEFVKEEVRRKVGNNPEALKYLQFPEQDAEPTVPDPQLRLFAEPGIEKVELVVRVKPPAVWPGTTLMVFYEDLVAAGPTGPPVRKAESFRLKPAYYSVRAEAPGYGVARETIRLPRNEPLSLELQQAAGAAAPAPWIGFSTCDRALVIQVIDPDGNKRASVSYLHVQQPVRGVYRARILTPEGGTSEQLFEYPFVSGNVTLEPPQQQIAPQQMRMLSEAGIPSEGPYLAPSKSLGLLSSLKPASLLGLAAYATYTVRKGPMSKLRSFGLQPVPEARFGEAWVSVLLAVESENGDKPPAAIFEQSGLYFYTREEPFGVFTPLPGFAAGAQHLRSVPEGNVTVEVRLPGVPPTRFPLTCFAGRIAVLCLALSADGSLDTQIYLIPFSGLDMDPHTFRTLEQAQRFYVGSAPIPTALIDALLNLKQLDPLLACLGGYTLVRQGSAERFRGAPDPNLPPGGWNPDSPMQNMLSRFGLLPDSHVLAGLCEPDRREQHYADAVAAGIPLFAEGFRVLLEHYRSRRTDLPVAMWLAGRTLAGGAAFSRWIGYEPALLVDQGAFGTPPLVWWQLEEHRGRIQAQLRAVGALNVENGAQSYQGTAFLIAPDLLLTAYHLVEPALETPGPASAWKPGVSVRFVTGDSVNQGQAHPVAQAVAADPAARIAILRLAEPVAGTEPLPVAEPGIAVDAGRRVYLAGFPFVDSAWDSALIRHVFGGRLGSKRLQPGFVVAAPEAPRNFDHDAFTLGGSAGSPVIDLESGSVLGVHWGGMIEPGFKRGRATAMWKPENRSVLQAAGVIAG